MIKSIGAQFGKPTGILGHLVGAVMAYENRARNLWAVSLLDIQPSDCVLEIGFGPGYAIQQMAKLATTGFVAGVDHSDVMVQQASRRNAAAIRAGQVELKHGSVAHLPYPNLTFDKAIVINSLHHWADSRAGLQEIRRVLKPAGLMIVVEQPRTAVTEATAAELGTHLMQQLIECGFQGSHFVIKAMKFIPSVAASGVK